MEDLKTKGSRQVCQYQFKKHDIVWICKSCQQDDTCVQCNECFMNADHTGHEVFFYHSQAGGCCDCGDSSSWATVGFCKNHGNISKTADFIGMERSALHRKLKSLGIKGLN